MPFTPLKYKNYPSCWLNYCLLGVFWLILFVQLRFEWMYNQQYEFGLFMPFISLYIIYLRYLDRPLPITDHNHKRAVCNFLVKALLVTVVIALYPLSVIFETNVDWRLIAWSKGLLIMLASLVMVNYWGGLQWVKHFFFPLFFLLFSIPWPKTIEIWMIEHLLYFVSHVTVDCLHLLGVNALQQGNLIQLKCGYVSMEEACSGVRSFQSSIMLGYFLGELFRLKIGERIFMLLVGSISAIVFNILRTLILALFVNTRGSGFMNEWHNVASNIVFLACLISLIGWSLVFKIYSPRTQAKLTNIREGHYFNRGYSLFILFLLFGIFPCTYAWYHYRVPELAFKDVTWSINWEEVGGATKISLKEIPLSVKETLMYDEGILGEWKSLEGYYHLAYYFRWDNPKKAQLGGFHGPELCLPSSGWSIPEEGPNIVFKKDEIELFFRGFCFSKAGNILYVFFAQWDRSGYPYYQKEGRMRVDRLKEVWFRHRSEGKTSFQFIVWGPKNLQEASKSLRSFLNDRLIIQKENH